MYQRSTTQFLCEPNGIIVTVMGLGAVDMLYLDTRVLNVDSYLHLHSFLAFESRLLYPGGTE